MSTYDTVGVGNQEIAAMQIREIRTIVTCPGRNFVVVKVITDEGIHGVGEGTLNGNELAVAQAIRHFTPLLIGRDPHRIEHIWHFLYTHGYWRGGPIQMAALSAIDIALWDIKGKIANLPVYQLLGGKARDGLMVYGHAGGQSHEACVDSVRSFQQRGYKVIRVQHGAYGGPGMVRRDPPRRPGLVSTSYFDATPYLVDTPRLFDHLRKHLGDEVELCHDVHERLTPIEAARLAKDLEPYRLFFLEDLLRPEHKDSWRLVRQASTTALALGELFVSRWDCLQLFQEQLIDFVRVKPQHVGGITDARKIFAMAEPYQIKSASHGARDIGPIGQAASVTVGAVIPNFGVQEWTSYSEATREVFPGCCVYHDGYAHPNEQPGLGIDIREDLAEKYPYQTAYMPHVRKVDGTEFMY